MSRFHCGTLILSLLAAVVAIPAVAEKAPLPEKMVSAKKVYFVSQTGWQKHADVAYTELKHWGRWEIVPQQENADLILVLNTKESVGTLGMASAYPAGAGAQAVGVGIPIEIPTYFLHVVDRASGQVLWMAKGHEGLLKSGIARRLVKELRKVMSEPR